MRGAVIFGIINSSHRRILGQFALGLFLALFFLASACSTTYQDLPAASNSSEPQVTPKIAPTVGKWRRHVFSFSNTSYSGNPFELEIASTFIHVSTGLRLTLPGYYDGNDTWKVAFMPTRVGDWRYTTVSPDPDLNGISGTIMAVESGDSGLLGADPNNPRKWKFADGGYVIPLSFRMDLFTEDGSDQRIAEIADFLNDDIEGQMLEGRLTRESGSPTYPIFAGNWRDHKFDLDKWQRFERRMEILSDRGLGFHLMFYSDDAGTPAWAAQSTTEKLLIRYTVARLASFPVVIFNTGIDIKEYRDQSWVNWFGEEIKALDPYGHPVSSRYGGGSGQLVMRGQTFNSRDADLALIDDMTNYFQVSDVPISMDDAWSENAPDAVRRGKDFSEHDIRRAVWKSVMAGGLGVIIRGSNLKWGDLYFRIGGFETDLESEQFLVHINPFVQSRLGDAYGSMVPDSSLVANGYAIADPARTKILYFLMGENDRYDLGNGGPLTLRLAGVSGTYSVTWFDPRTGAEIPISSLAGGSDHTLTPPSKDDWVLLLESAETELIDSD